MAEKLTHTLLIEMTRWAMLLLVGCLHLVGLVIQVPSEPSSFTLQMEAARFSEM